MTFEEQKISHPTPKFLQSLWLEDKHCRCCGRPTRLLKLGNGRPPTDVATVEHKYPRGHQLREPSHPLYETARLVRTLYCWKCNHDSDQYFKRTGQIYSWDKSDEYQSMVSSIEEARQRARKRKKYHHFCTIQKSKSLIPWTNGLYS